MENLICYTLREDNSKKVESEEEWLRFVNSLADTKNNIHSVSFVNEGAGDISILGTVVKAGAFKIISSPTPGGNIDIRSVKVNFDDPSVLSVNIQRIYDLHVKQLQVR